MRVCTCGVRTAIPVRCQSLFVFGVLSKNKGRTNKIKLSKNGLRTRFVDLLILFAALRG